MRIYLCVCLYGGGSGLTAYTPSSLLCSSPWGTVFLSFTLGSMAFQKFIYFLIKMRCFFKFLSLIQDAKIAIDVKPVNVMSEL